MLRFVSVTLWSLCWWRRGRGPVVVLVGVMLFRRWEVPLRNNVFIMLQNFDLTTMVSRRWIGPCLATDRGSNPRELIFRGLGSVAPFGDVPPTVLFWFWFPIRNLLVMNPCLTTWYPPVCFCHSRLRFVASQRSTRPSSQPFRSGNLPVLFWRSGAG